MEKERIEKGFVNLGKIAKHVSRSQWPKIKLKDIC